MAASKRTRRICSICSRNAWMNCCSKVEGEVLWAVGMSCFWHSLLAVDSERRTEDAACLSWADNRARAHVEVLREFDGRRSRARAFRHAVSHVLLAREVVVAPRCAPRTVRLETALDGFRRVRRASLDKTTARFIYRWRQAPVYSTRTAAILTRKCCRICPSNATNCCRLATPTDALELNPHMAARWPRLARAKWFAALGDGACSNIGGGGVDASTLALNAGTSGALRVVLPGFTKAKRRADCGATAWTNAALSWAARFPTSATSSRGHARRLQLPDNWQALLESMPPDSHGLSVLPFLAGERAPIWNPNAHFALAGAGLHTSPMDILRACLEAAALRYRVLGRFTCCRSRQTLKSCFRAARSNTSQPGKPSCATRWLVRCAPRKKPKRVRAARRCWHLKRWGKSRMRAKSHRCAAKCCSPIRREARVTNARWNGKMRCMRSCMNDFMRRQMGAVLSDFEWAINVRTHFFGHELGKSLMLRVGVPHPNPPPQAGEGTTHR